MLNVSSTSPKWYPGSLKETSESARWVTRANLGPGKSGSFCFLLLIFFLPFIFFLVEMLHSFTFKKEFLTSSVDFYSHSQIGSFCNYMGNSVEIKWNQRSVQKKKNEGKCICNVNTGP